jgi:hypothetical protein
MANWEGYRKRVPLSDLILWQIAGIPNLLLLLPLVFRHLQYSFFFLFLFERKWLQYRFFNTLNNLTELAKLNVIKYYELDLIREYFISSKLGNPLYHKQEGCMVHMIVCHMQHILEFGHLDSGMAICETCVWRRSWCMTIIQRSQPYQVARYVNSVKGTVCLPI